MKKILLFAGIILLCVLILSTWFFIGNLGDLAKFLGKESENTFVDEKTRFIGTWESTKDFSCYTFKTDGSFTYNYIHGTYEINENNILLLNFDVETHDEDYYSSDYNYQFSTDDTILTLYDVDTLETTIVLNKIQ